HVIDTAALTCRYQKFTKASRPTLEPAGRSRGGCPEGQGTASPEPASDFGRPPVGLPSPEVRSSVGAAGTAGRRSRGPRIPRVAACAEPQRRTGPAEPRIGPRPGPIGKKGRAVRAGRTAAGSGPPSGRSPPTWPAG